jgi:hypothetical protein
MGGLNSPVGGFGDLPLTRKLSRISPNGVNRKRKALSRATLLQSAEPANYSSLGKAKYSIIKYLIPAFDRIRGLFYYSQYYSIFYSIEFLGAG